MLSPPYRIGPWPGLTPSGAAVLVTCAVLLALGQLVVGGPHRALPDVPIVALAAIVPLVLATRVVNAPGAASAVCGAYLLPRALLSLADPSLPLPPVLMVAALTFDMALWLRASDLRRRRRVKRDILWWRGALAGVAFGVTLALIEPPFELFLGANAAAWAAPDVWQAATLSALACGFVAMLSARGTAS